MEQGAHLELGRQLAVQIHLVWDLGVEAHALAVVHWGTEAPREVLRGAELVDHLVGGFLVLNVGQVVTLL